MNRQPLLKACLVLLLVVACLPASAQEKSRYEELLASPGAANTIQSFALMIMAAPLRPAEVDEQLRKIWWANSPDVQMNDAERTLVMSDYQNQLEEVAEVLGRHRVFKLDLAGFSKIGTQRNLEFYYAGDTPRGPVVIRLSATFSEQGSPMVHAIRVFEGFDAAREAVADIQHHAGQRVASYTISPKKEVDAEDDPGGAPDAS